MYDHWFAIYGPSRKAKIAFLGDGKKFLKTFPLALIYMKNGGENRFDQTFWPFAKATLGGSFLNLKRP